MPCDTITTLNLVLDPTRVAVLDEAMKKLGFASAGERTWTRYGTSVTLEGNDLRITGGSWEAQRLKERVVKATSTVIVEKAAKRNGWQLKWLSDGKAVASRTTYGR
jgi:hypothetical protein